MTLNVPHLDNSTCCFFEDDPVDNDQTVRQLCCSAMLYISVSGCTWTLSALEALRNALYKFKTYLLTYLLCSSDYATPPLRYVLLHFGDLLEISKLTMSV